MNNPPAQLVDLEPIFGNVVSLALGIGGLLLFIMIIMGGIRLISAGGDAKAAEGAKNTVTWAIYGVVILALAYLFLRLIAQLTGVDEILNFQISQP